MSTFFQRARTAAIIGSMFIFFCFFPFYTCKQSQLHKGSRETDSTSLKLGLSLFYPVTFGLGIQQVALFEDQGAVTARISIGVTNKHIKRTLL